MGTSDGSKIDAVILVGTGVVVEARKGSLHLGASRCAHPEANEKR